MMLVPLTPEPDQRLQIILNGQNTTLRVYAREGGLYTDVAVDDVLVWTGFIARNAVPCKLYPYLPFAGQMVFVDMQGMEDPRWDGLGTRWQLVYLSDDEVMDIFQKRNP